MDPIEFIGQQPDIKYKLGDHSSEWEQGEECQLVEFGVEGFYLYRFLDFDDTKTVYDYRPPKTCEMRYTVIDDICYFCFRFGDAPWFSCPYAPALYVTSGYPITIPEIPSEEWGYALNWLLIDMYDGVLAAMAQVRIRYEISQRWREWALENVKVRLPIAEYRKRVEEAYQKYSLANLLEMGEPNADVVPVESPTGADPIIL